MVTGLTLLWLPCLPSHFLLPALPISQVYLKMSIMLVMGQRALFLPQTLAKYGIHPGHFDLDVLLPELDKLIVPG